MAAHQLRQLVVTPSRLITGGSGEPRVPGRHQVTATADQPTMPGLIWASSRSLEPRQHREGQWRPGRLSAVRWGAGDLWVEAIGYWDPPRRGAPQLDLNALFRRCRFMRNGDVGPELLLLALPDELIRLWLLDRRATNPFPPGGVAVISQTFILARLPA